MPIKFFVPGKPQGKARARTVRTRGGRSVSYTPEKTVVYEGKIRKAFQEASGLGPADGPLYGSGIPVKIGIEAYYEPAASTSRKRLILMQEGVLLPLKKPDIDNVVKAVCDALNGWAYKDDTQVVYLAASKYYSAEEGLWITVSSALEER